MTFSASCPGISECGIVKLGYNNNLFLYSAIGIQKSAFKYSWKGYEDESAGNG
jgi:hypothetical protein